MAIRAQVILPMDSGIPADVAVNTWHFSEEGADLSASIFNIHAALDTFYQAVDTYLSVRLDATKAHVKYYLLSDPKPRQPRADNALSTLGTGTDTLPQELAICVSFKGAFVSGEPPARRRGRIFLGPLAQGAMGSSSVADRISSSARPAIAAAAGALLATSNASSTFSWVVYSEVDNATRDVVSGWVDDAFDVQRRRGVFATTRTNF